MLTLFEFMTMFAVVALGITLHHLWLMIKNLEQSLDVTMPMLLNKINNLEKRL